VTIELERAAALRVTYLGPEPSAFVHVRRDDVVVARHWVRSGTSGVLTVPAGPLTVHAGPTVRSWKSTQALPWTRDVVAVLGEEAEVELP